MKNKNKKIKDIKIDSKRFSLSLMFMSILFDIVLIFGLYVLVKVIPKWYVYLGAGLVLVAMTAWIIFTFVQENKAHKYELFEDHLKIKSMWQDVDIDLKTVFGAVPYISYRDHISKESSGIKLIIKNKIQSVRLIHFIAEDPVALCNEIMTLATKAREIENK